MRILKFLWRNTNAILAPFFAVHAVWAYSVGMPWIALLSATMAILCGLYWRIEFLNRASRERS